MCCSIYSSHIIQKLLDYTQEVNLKNEFFSIIIFNFLKIAVNCNGLHVIMKVIELFKNDKNDNSIPNDYDYKNLFTEKNQVSNKLTLKYIYCNVVYYLKSLCCDKYGCCFVQKLFKSVELEFRTFLINLIMNEFFEEFVNHQYASYVLQEIISFKNYEVNSYILNYVSRDLLEFSKNKAISNIIETLLKEWSAETMKLVVKEIELNNEFIRELVLNNYGNYGKKKKIYTNTYIYKLFIIIL
jgi:hypothetical protein